MYDINSEFDIEKHKQTFLNYLEVMIDRRGKVHYAVPSHQEFMIARGMEKHKCSREEYIAMCPVDYYMEWLMQDTGYVAVWESHFIGVPNEAQMKSLEELKQAGLYKGEIEIMHELEVRKHKDSLIGIVKSGTEAQQVMADYGIESTEELEKALAFWNDQDSDRLKRLTERDEPKKVIVRETGDHIVQVICPSCTEVLEDDGKSYCPNCGQHLDWEEADKCLK
jgi:rubrerythrin